MFKKLRNRLILINCGVTTTVIVIVFSVIYVTAISSANDRAPMAPNEVGFYPEDVAQMVQLFIADEKRAAANDLLIRLIVSGLAIELMVVLISYLLGEEAIKPVKEAYESQKIFIANASHEIKTPLAAISANLEAADIQGNKWIDNVEKETEKLTELNGKLLTLARTDLIEKSAKEEIEIGKLTEELVTGFEPRLNDVRLVKKINKDERILINKADYVQIFDILMDNAIKYSQRRIRVELKERELAVANDGATISEDAAKHVFERFYQEDKSAEGVGLGLSIAQSLAIRNNWKLTVEAGKSETLFRLKL